MAQDDPEERGPAGAPGALTSDLMKWDREVVHEGGREPLGPAQVSRKCCCLNIDKDLSSFDQS